LKSKIINHAQSVENEAELEMYDHLFKPLPIKMIAINGQNYQNIIKKKL